MTGAGTVTSVAVVAHFGTKRMRIMTPFAWMTKL
jgi:hypothetical protein